MTRREFDAKTKRNDYKMKTKEIMKKLEGLTPAGYRLMAMAAVNILCRHETRRTIEERLFTNSIPDWGYHTVHDGMTLLAEFGFVVDLAASIDVVIECCDQAMVPVEDQAFIRRLLIDA